MFQTMFMQLTPGSEIHCNITNPNKSTFWGAREMSQQVNTLCQTRQCEIYLWDSH